MGSSPFLGTNFSSLDFSRSTDVTGSEPDAQVAELVYAYV